MAPWSGQGLVLPAPPGLRGDSPGVPGPGKKPTTALWRGRPDRRCVRWWVGATREPTLEGQAHQRFPNAGWRDGSLGRLGSVTWGDPFSQGAQCSRPPLDCPRRAQVREPLWAQSCWGRPRKAGSLHGSRCTRGTRELRLVTHSPRKCCPRGDPTTQRATSRPCPGHWALAGSREPHLLLASSSSALSFPISICSCARSRAVSSSTLRASASSASYSVLMPLTWGHSKAQVKETPSQPTGAGPDGHSSNSHQSLPWPSPAGCQLPSASLLASPDPTSRHTGPRMCIDTCLKPNHLPD